MEQFAPGPYRVRRIPTLHSPTTWYSVVMDARGLPLCPMAHDNLPVRCEVGGRQVVVTPQQVEATARLFAASWRLLSESRRVLALLRGQDNPFISRELLEAADGLQAAVAETLPKTKVAA